MPKRLNWIFRISVILNAVLLTAAIWAFNREQPAPASVPSSETPVPEQPLHAATGMEEGNEVTSVTTVTNDFHWRFLESTNYDEFVANLRSVGCPNRTIRDIIFADAERRYADLESMTVEPVAFWVAGKARAEVGRRNDAARTEATTALRNELRQLFGVDWSVEESETSDLRFQALSRLVVGPVPDEQHEQAWRWAMNLIQLGRNFRQERGRTFLTADLVEWQKIVAAKQVQAEKIFGPVAYEEFRARTSFLEEAFESRLLQLKELELTPSEVRAACLLKAREIGWLGDLFNMERNRSETELESRKIAFTAALKEVLSPDHFEEFVRVQDEDYRKILAATRDNNLPRTSAQKVYEVRQLAEAEYRRLKTEADSDEKAVALATLQLSMTDSVRKILGSEVFNKFAARNGQWVTNFTKL